MPDPRELLKISLSAAVPLWIEQFRRLPWQEVNAIAKEASQVIAERGDVILFRSKRRGETAAAFNALAKGIAALSFVPGGVTTFGMHFEEKHEGEAVAVATREPVNLTFQAGTLGRFILRLGLGIRWREVERNPWITEDEPWAAEAKHYAVDVHDPFGKSFSTYFSKGSGATDPPSIEEVLGAVGMDAALFERTSDVEHYAKNLKRDPDDPEVVKEYEDFSMQAQDLRAFLGEDAYRELVGLTETA